MRRKGRVGDWGWEGDQFLLEGDGWAGVRKGGNDRRVYVPLCRPRSSEGVSSVHMTREPPDRMLA